MQTASDHSSNVAALVASQSAARHGIADPPPLDDSLARFLLHVITRFFYTSASTINTDTINHAYGTLADDHYSVLTDGTAASSFRVPHSSADLLTDIHKQAGRVMQYLSASNWPIVFAKIKLRITSLAQTSTAPSSGAGGGSNANGASSGNNMATGNAGGGSSGTRSGAGGPSGGGGDRDGDGDGGGDLTELRFLEWCSINRYRLGMILAEMTYNLRSFTKRALFASSISLRIAIWNWIEAFPTEFQILCSSFGRMEGQPDQLFDIFNGFADSSRRKALFWPVQTMLAVLCPDLVYAIGLAGGGRGAPPLSSSATKKAMFLDGIKKNIRTGKVGEVSVLCCMDFVKASTFAGRQEGGAMKLLAATFEVELREKLFDPQRPLALTNGLAASEEPGVIDHRLLGECIAAMYKANPWTTLRTVVPIVLDAGGSLYKVALVKALCSVINEPPEHAQLLPWNPSGVDASLAQPLRILFADCAQLHRQTGVADAKARKAPSFRSSNTDRKIKKAAQEEANERFQVLINVLTMWNICPLLAIVKDAGTLHPEELRPLFTSLTVCLLDSHPLVRHLAGQMLLKLMARDVVPYWDGTVTDWRAPPPQDTQAPSDAAMRSFWRGSSWILLGVTRTVLDDLAEARRGAELALKLLGRRNEVLASRRGCASIGADVPERFAACVAMEVAIIVSLSGGWSDGGVGKMVAGWLEAVLEEGDLVRAGGGGAAVGAAPLLENASVYADLVKVVTGGGGGGGLKVVQKRARAILRGLTVPTPGNMGGWEEMYKIWKINGSLPSSGGRKRSGSMGNNGNNLDGGSGMAESTGSGSNAGTGHHTTDSWTGPSISSASGASSPSTQQAMMEDIEAKRVRRTGSGIGVATFMGDERAEWINQMAFLCALGGICLKASAMAVEQQQLQEVGGATAGRNNAAPFNVSDGGRRKSTGSAPPALAADNGPESPAVQVPWTGMVGAQLMTAYSGARQTVERFIGELVELVVSDTVVVREAVKECLGLEMGIGMYGILFGHFTYIINTQMFDPATSQPRLTARNTLFADYISSVLRLALDRPDAGTVLSSASLGENVDLGYVVVQLIRYLDTLALVDATSLRLRMRLCMAIELLVAKRDAIGLCGEMRVRKEIAEALLEAGLDGTGEDPSVVMNRSPESRKLQKGADLACVKALVKLLEDLPLGRQKAERYCGFLVRGLERWLTGEDLDVGPFREATVQALTNLVAANTDAELGCALDMVYAENEQLRGVFAVVLTELVRKGCLDQSKLQACLGSREETTRARHIKLLDLLTSTPGGIDVAVALGEVAPVGDVDEVASVLVHLFENSGRSLDLVERVVRREVENTDTPANLFRRNSIATRLLTIYAKQHGVEYLRSTLSPILSELAERCPPMSFEVDPLKCGTGDADANMRNLRVVSQGILDSVIGPPGAGRLPPFLRDVCATIWRLVGTRFPDARITAVGGFLFLRFICPAIVSPETHNLIPTNDGELKKELRRGLVLITKVVQNLANNVLFGVKEAFMSGVNDVLRDNVSKVHGFLRDVSLPMTPASPAAKPQLGAGLSDSDMVKLQRNMAANLDRIERLQRLQGSLTNPALHHAHPSTTVSSPTGTVRPQARRSASHVGTLLAEPQSPIGSQKTNTELKQVPPLSIPKSAFAEMCLLLAQLGPASAADQGSMGRRIEVGQTLYSQVTWVKGYRSHVPVLLAVGPEKLQILTRRSDGSDVIEDTHHAADIEEFGMAREQELVVRVVSRAHGSTTLTFAAAKAEGIVHTLKTMLSAWRSNEQQTSNSNSNSRTGRRALTPAEVPGALLSVAFMTAGSADSQVRRNGYDLLCATCEAFDVPVSVGNVGGQRILHGFGKGLFVPFSSGGFVLDVVKRIAHSRPDLTMSVLNEAAWGLSTSCPESLKIVILMSLEPWIRTLAACVYEDVTGDAKLNSIVLMLVEATVREPALDAFFRSTVWTYLAQQDTLVPQVIETLLAAACDSAPRPHAIEVIANITHAMARTTSYPVSSKLLAQLRKAIVSTSYRATATLVDHAAWTEIAVLVRIATHVAFDDWSNVHNCLPDVCYVVSMVAGIGSPLVRASVHGALVNTVHALATSGVVGEGKRKALGDLVRELAGPKLGLPFGVVGVGEQGSEVAREVTLGGLELVVRCLLDVAEAGAKDSDQAGLWRARWMSFVASTAFQYNPAIQPRAFIVLGCLARDQVDDDLFYQILVALRGALTLFDLSAESAGTNASTSETAPHLIVSITMALCDIVAGLPADSRYLRPMFWLAMALCQIAHVPIFQSACILLVVTLRRLHDTGAFQNENRDPDCVARVLLGAREGLENVSVRIDQLVGIKFGVELFAHAVSANLVRGLKHPTTKTGTTAALEMFCDIAGNGGIHTLGYVVPLIPSAEKPADLWKRAGLPIGNALERDARRTLLDEDAGHARARVSASLLRNGIFNSTRGVDDRGVVMTSVLFWAAMLDAAEYDMELVTIYAALAEAAETAPEAFAVVSDYLTPRLTQTLATS
ncbi:Ras GTPase activating protein ira2, partial [Thoreauomyces humboldtii]